MNAEAAAVKGEVLWPSEGGRGRRLVGGEN